MQLSVIQFTIKMFHIGFIFSTSPLKELSVLTLGGTCILHEEKPGQSCLNSYFNISIHVPCVFCYFVQWTNKCTQLFNKLSHRYMFRHYRVILSTACNKYIAKLHQYFKCNCWYIKVNRSPTSKHLHHPRKKNIRPNLLKTNAAIWFNKTM
jgi:hypothetical protein